MESIKEKIADESSIGAIFQRIFTSQEELASASEKPVDSNPGICEGFLDDALKPGEKNNLNTSKTIAIYSTEDIVKARQDGRSLVKTIGFSNDHATIVATAISELARNMLLYAKSGEITITGKIDGYRIGVMVEAVDDGPGIANIRTAMKSGYSTSGGLGLGLSGVRDMVDEFVIRSHEGEGTSVVATLWLR
jgi:serine/threonine-protein kinase RsbT